MNETTAGWYPDESDVLRWWDGARWTDRVAPPGTAAASGPPPAAPEVGSRRARRGAAAKEPGHGSRRRPGHGRTYVIAAAVLGVALVALVVAVVVIIATDDDPGGGTTNGAKDSCSSLRYAGQQTTDVCGDTSRRAAVGGLVVTTTPLAPPSTPSAVKPLCSRVVLQNVAGGAQAFDAKSFSLLTPPRTLDSFTIAGVNPGALTPGASVTGTICFSQTATATGQLVLAYRPDPTKPDRAIWITNR